MIKPSDLKILSVDKTDYDKIFEYTENNFAKNRYNSDTIKSAWINPTKTLNPNFTGILGEWVLNSDNDPDLKPFSDLLCRGFKRITSLTMKDRNFNI
jgi:hypothetical protein